MTLHSRRDVLRLGSAAAAMSLAGCASLPFSSRPRLTLTLVNRSPDPVWFYVEFFRADRTERSEAYVFDQRYTVQGRDDGGETRVTDENVVASHPYLVRVEVDDADGRQVDQTHFHFYPDCTGSDEPPEELYVEFNPVESSSENDEYAIEFARNTCGSDASVY